MTVQEIMEEAGCEGARIFAEPSFETAFIGISHDDRAVYDFDKMVEYGMKEFGWTVEQARDFIISDTICSCRCTQGAPIVLFARETGGNDADY